MKVYQKEEEQWGDRRQDERTRLKEDAEGREGWRRAVCEAKYQLRHKWALQFV